MIGAAPDNQPLPTPFEAMEAQLVLLDGLNCVEHGCWDKSMQADRDKARAVVDRARAAGIL